MKKRHLPVMVLACLLMTSTAIWSQDGLEEALTAAREGRLTEALEAVDMALSTDPESVRALFTRGVILAESGRREAAEKTFQRLIERHPDLPEAYNNLAVIQAANGDFDGAVNTLKSALATNPAYQTAYENLTRIFAQLASEAYSRALEVDSPPARAEVDLQMLAALSATAPAQEPLPSISEAVADRTVVPAEPMLAKPAEPMAAPEPETEPGPATERAEEPAAVESEDLQMAEVDAEPEASAAQPAPTGALSGLVDQWARAWSDQRVDDYLSFYADDFVPDNGMTRLDWESNRRERIGAPDFINVEVAILDSVADGVDRATVTFLQAYESDTYSDQVTKTLTLVRNGVDWKILEEKSGS